MGELSASAAVIEIANPAPWVRKWPAMLHTLLPVLVASLVSISSIHAQSANPVGQPPPPRAIYTPKPIYRPEWAKQGLTGKGIVLVTIDKQRGNVTGARMVTSTGNSQLDGAALQAYSQWRFTPERLWYRNSRFPSSLRPGQGLRQPN